MARADTVMTHDDMAVPGRLTADLMSAAIEHVRLSYHYLDRGEVDAYCSLFTEQAVLRIPGARPIIGRAELERVGAQLLTTNRVQHLVSEVFGSGRRIAAVGRHCPPPGTSHDAGIEFADVFTVAEDGLLVDRTTFLFVPATGDR